MATIEAVPNFSEGRNEEVINAIRDAAGAVDGVKVIDVQSDKDHNRMVLTLAGDVEPVMKGVMEASKVAIEKIDLRQHKGEHKRMGAVDVAPFVPVSGIKKKELKKRIEEFAEEFAKNFNVPVYLYYESSKQPNREKLPDIRDGEFEGFAKKIVLPEWKPDFGPDKVHESAGCTAIGLRPFLIAFNVNLRTTNVEIAKQIAKAVRGSSGGYATVQGAGFMLEDQGVAQVSMNILDYKKTSIYRVVETIRSEASRYGVEIDGCELVGMAPMDAFLECAEFYLRMTEPLTDHMLENKIWG
ncbi:MAG TPA: glutamate formimidoyltransferase [Firmicutes bacterium]|nr:glutamate formimidoyltransferase [Bacillota bacterium]